MMSEFKDIIGLFHGWIDPHLPPYNCKGDAIATYDAATDASGTLAIPGYAFRSADVGKLVFSDLFAGSRTIASVANGRATLSGAALAANATNRAVFFGTDDTAGLQQALDDAQYTFGYAAQSLDRGAFVGAPTGYSTNGVFHGRVVRLRGGGGYMVGNSQAAYSAGKHAALVQRRRTGLVGEARESSWIFLMPGRYGYGVMNENADSAGDRSSTHPTDAYCDGMLLNAFTIDGMAGFGGATNALDNLHWHTSFNGYTRVDPRNECMGITSKASARDAVFMSGRGDLFLSRVHAETAAEIGLHIKRITDTTIEQCMSGGARRTGIKIDACQDLFVLGTKSYYSGINGGAASGDCANWWLTADQAKNGLTSLIGCRAQEARGSNFLVESGYNTLSGCQAQDAGQANGLDAGTLPTVRAGLHLSGAGAVENRIDMSVTPCVRMFPGPPSAPYFLGTHAAYLDGATGTKGALDTIGLMDGTYAVAKVGGPGATNGTNVRLRVDGVALT